MHDQIVLLQIDHAGFFIKYLGEELFKGNISSKLFD